MRSLTALAFALMWVGSGAAEATSPKPFGPKAAVLSNRKMSDDDKARQVTHDFAACMLRREATRFEAALAVFPVTSSYKALARVADSDCLYAGQLRMPPTLLRGSAFRALYTRDFAAVAPLQASSRMDYLGEAGADEQARIRATLTEFGSCVARTNPSASRALVLADVATREEADAIAALRSSLGDCLRDGTLKLSRAVLQSILAEVLYREASLQGAR